ncbi:MAG: HAD family hydrolase [Cyanobacteria bacterium P01_H01_bin.35]
MTQHPQHSRLLELPVVAVFDFDGTLTHRDSFLPFLRFLLGPSRFDGGLLLMSPVLIGYALKLIANWQAKEALLKFFLGGKSQKQLNQIGEQFAVQQIPKLLRPEGIQRLQWHQNQGHLTILVSASLEIYLFPWTKKMSFNQVIGTRLETDSGVVTGRILGKNCYGSEKVERLKAILGNLNQYCIYAYGDSRGDRQLLDIANYPYYRTFETI